MYKTENVRNYDSGKVAKFQDAKVSDFGVNLKNPSPNRVKRY